MRFLLLLLLTLPLIAEEGSLTPENLATAAKLRDQAMKGTRAFEIVESLTTEVGPRLAGTPGDRAGVAWAQAKLKELGFDKVWTEKITFPYWIRGDASCKVTSPYPQNLIITALGNSVGTPDEGIEAEMVHVPTFEALLEADRAAIEDKIVFISNQMERHKQGMGYGKAVVARRSGASAAAKLGARAVLIRSIGTDSHRLPHTGTMVYEEGVTRIPAAALSNPDANLLEHMLKRGKPITVALHMTARSGGSGTSHNVIGEIKGREKPEEVILLGAHLDSWDLGTGAIDDGAGVAIVTEAARIIGQMKQRPRRTIRVVLYGNEEGGLWGAQAYAKAHRETLSKHIIGSESDFGAGLIWRFDTQVAENARPTFQQIGKVLAPLGIEMGPNQAFGGPDLIPLKALGMPVATLQQDGTDYFDVHHTADDTLDKIDPKSMDQNVAAYVVFAYLTAEAPIQFRDLEPDAPLSTDKR